MGGLVLDEKAMSWDNDESSVWWGDLRMIISEDGEAHPDIST